jgi:hypothetical protein
MITNDHTWTVIFVPIKIMQLCIVSGTDHADHTFPATPSSPTERPRLIKIRFSNSIKALRNNSHHPSGCTIQGARYASATSQMSSLWALRCRKNKPLNHPHLYRIPDGLPEHRLRAHLRRNPGSDPHHQPLGCTEPRYQAPPVKPLSVAAARVITHHNPPAAKRYPARTAPKFSALLRPHGARQIKRAGAAGGELRAPGGGWGWG